MMNEVKSIEDEIHENLHELKETEGTPQKINCST
jgi:hypothetical protein